MLSYALQVVTPLLNSTISNSTDYSSTLKLINASPAVGGTIGLVLSMVVFCTVTLILSYRIKVTQAALAGAFFGMLASIFMVVLGLTDATTTMLFVGLILILTFLTVMSHILHPLD